MSTFNPNLTMDERACLGAMVARGFCTGSIAVLLVTARVYRLGVTGIATDSMLMKENIDKHLVEGFPSDRPEPNDCGDGK